MAPQTGATWGGTVSDFLSVAGGLAVLGGPAADATVVGSVIGVPLQAIGGILLGAGALGKWVFGDSEEEKELKHFAEHNLPTH